jgi:2-keto-4-pentenoate hydratase/2-oxohepta-3-ene-1,7-dioic acid hydratase in catechol pathway
MRFKLGTFSVAGGGAPFPGLVLEQPQGAGTRSLGMGGSGTRGTDTSGTADRVVPFARLEPLLTRLNLQLRARDSLLSLLADWDANFQALAILCETFPSELARASVPVDDFHIRAPIDPPRQVFCTVANFRGHVVESIVDYGVPPHTDGMDADARRAYADKVIEERLRSVPYACFKLPSTVIGPHDPLEIPRHVQRLDWELELGVVIGRTARRVSRSSAMSYVAGYVIVNDITARDMVRRTDVPAMGTDWLQGKNGPGFLPMGPYFVPAAFRPDPYTLRLMLSLNDRHMQDCQVSDMLFDIATQIEYISQHARLLPGDVICTGTPAGCGTHYKRYLQPGDVIHGGAAELGTQHTPCVEEPS